MTSWDSFAHGAAILGVISTITAATSIIVFAIKIWRWLHAHQDLRWDPNYVPESIILNPDASQRNEITQNILKLGNDLTGLSEDLEKELKKLSPVNTTRSSLGTFRLLLIAIWNMRSIEDMKEHLDRLRLAIIPLQQVPPKVSLCRLMSIVTLPQHMRVLTSLLSVRQYKVTPKKWQI